MEISRRRKPPDLSHREVNSPGQGLGKISEISLIEFHATTSKQCQIFLSKGACSMMFLLSLNVTSNFFQLRSAYRKTSISFLPRKGANTDLFVDPFGRN